jgi:hypothetical protein
MKASEIIQKVKTAYLHAKSASVRVQARERGEDERARAEIELICDDLATNGINPNSPLGLTCIVEIGKHRLQKIAEEMRRENRTDDDRDEFTRGLV